jgi:hypothetical protein
MHWTRLSHLAKGIVVATLCSFAATALAAEWEVVDLGETRISYIEH